MKMTSKAWSIDCYSFNFDKIQFFFSAQLSPFVREKKNHIL